VRRFAAAALVCASALIVVPHTASAADCAGADRAPQQLGAAAARTVTLCLLNRERAARGLAPLRPDRRLTRAAQGHSADMVAHRYFAHDSRDGASFGTRIARTGWTRHRRVWTLGENIAWGEREAATPAAIVDAWMHSAGHRRNILDARFRAIGIGIVSGTPGADRGATYSTDFAGR
jgi:uncharacterized protein YkwD